MARKLQYKITVSKHSILLAGYLLIYCNISITLIKGRILGRRTIKNINICGKLLFTLNDKLQNKTDD